MKYKVISKSAQSTQEAGKLFAENLSGGEVVALCGDLGAGKTTFIQGLASGLKIKEKIKSPTFVIFNRYKVEGKKVKWLYHFDLYRISDPMELLDLGFDEITKQKNAVTVIEWAEKIPELLPKHYIKISFQYLSKNSRKLSFSEGLKS